MPMPFQNRDVSRQLQSETGATGLMGDDSVTDAAAATAVAVGAITAASVAARTSGGIALTYSGNDPTNTPNNAVTITDGDVLAAAEVHEMFDELEGELIDLGVDDEAIATTADALVVDMAEAFTAIDALIVDNADIRTQLNLAITALEAAGVISA